MKKAFIFWIIALISVSSLFRGLYFSYDTYAFLTGLALLCAFYFINKLYKNEPVQINKAIVICGVILICSAALSFFWAMNPRKNLDTVILYVELLLISMVLYDYFHDSKRIFIKWLMIPVATIGFVCAVVGLTALSGYLFWEVTFFGNRIGSTFQYANTAAIYFVVSLIFVLTLVDAVDNILLKALFSGMGGVIVLALLMTGSRGGYLVAIVVLFLLLALQPYGHRIRGAIGFICMLAPVFLIMKNFNLDTRFGDIAGTIFWIIMLFTASAVSSLLINLLFRLLTKGKDYKSPRGTGYVFSAAALICAGFAAMFRDRLIQLFPRVLMDRMARLAQQGFNDINILYRLEYDKDALKLIRGNWLFGVGGGGWEALYQSVQDFFYTAAFVHNNYFQIFVESGIFGFISFVVLVLISLWNAIRVCFKSVDPRLRTYCAGLLCAMIALAGHSACDFDLSYASMLLLLWSMLTAAAVSIPKGSTPAAAAGGKKHAASADATAGRYAVTVLTIVCSVLLTINALYFTAAQNAQIAFNYAQEKDYRMSLAYYEEAGRLDTGNTKYSFEIAKLYRYLANKSNDEDTRNAWLKKAREASEKSVAGNRHYPAYINTLTRIYLDSDMPLEALKSSQELISNQRYYAENYELLARSYLAAADYYAADGNTKEAKQLLEKCLEIDKDTCLPRSIIDMPNELNSADAISKYRHSESLSEYLKEAETKLYDLKSKSTG